MYMNISWAMGVGKGEGHAVVRYGTCAPSPKIPVLKIGFMVNTLLQYCYSTYIGYSSSGGFAHNPSPTIGGQGGVAPLKLKAFSLLGDPLIRQI